MKIRNDLKSRDVDKKKSNTSARKVTGNPSFASTLSHVGDSTDSYGKEIDVLKNEIRLAGDKLEQEPTLDNFRKFKELLSRFAKRINAEAYCLEKIGGTALNPRYFEAIKVINKEADELYTLIVSEQRNRMAIIEKVIGIKGLVVNLVT
jgi:uncharacterized protein YaaR (DUF327 family)